MPIPVVIGDLCWPSKKAALESVRELLERNPDHRPLGPDDHALAMQLVLYGHHNEIADKVGPGVASCHVAPTEWGTRSLVLVRQDGTAVDFSLRSAINGPPTHAADVRAALREEVAEQIREFADATRIRSSDCGMCGLRLGEKVHVDHADPLFTTLVEMFVLTVGGWSGLLVDCVGSSGRRLVDRAIAMGWEEFHARNARLRLVHPSCNLSRPRGGLDVSGPI